MDLIRNTTKDSSCKYALIRLDKMRKDGSFESIEQFLKMYPELKEYIEFGEPNTEEEFFVIKLKDIFSTNALLAYSTEASNVDIDYGVQVMDLALRSGKRSSFCKFPDLVSGECVVSNFKSDNNKPDFPKSELKLESHDPLKPSPSEHPKGLECQYNTDGYHSPIPSEEELIKQGLKVRQPGFFEGMWLTFKSIFKLGK